MTIILHTYKSNLFKATHEFTKENEKACAKGLYKIQFEIENKMPTTKINWLVEDGLIFLYSYQVLIRVKMVICL